MKWTKLNSIDQLTQLEELSNELPVVIFKHSTRCSISAAVLDRLERNWKELELPAHQLFFLDLIQYRSVSDAIAQRFLVNHESPQLIILNQRKSVYHKSHFDIDYSNVKDALRAAAMTVTKI